MAEVSEVKLPEVRAVEEIDRLAVTVPLIAGSEPMVTLLPIVTEEMLMGTVPLMDAVTEPICDVPAPSVTEPAIVCVPVGLAVTVPDISPKVTGA